MSTPRRLSDEAFKATFSFRMTDVTAEPGDVIDIGPYVASVPPEDLAGHEVQDGLVAHVYRGSQGRYDHVLVMTRTRDVFLAIVVDRTDRRIEGHHLLDLPALYGLRE